VAEVVAPLPTGVDAAAVNVEPTGQPLAPDAAPALPDLSGLSGLSGLAQPATAAPGGLLPATREVLATPEARSLAAVLAIALGLLLFLAVQGRFDRGEPKLVGGRDERDVARFR